LEKKEKRVFLTFQKEKKIPLPDFLPSENPARKATLRNPRDFAGLTRNGFSTERKSPVPFKKLFFTE
jgi:hypothetical protein